LNRDIIKRPAGNKSAFIRFLREISRTSSYENAAWTNLAKIGVENGNPSPKLLDLQKPLAVKTLKYEIRSYNPTLVVFVSDNYFDEVVLEATGTSEDDWEFEKGSVDENAWWINRTANKPRFVWTTHPQGKRKEVINYWIEKAKEIDG
jgi:hypothetical protein